MQKDPDETRKIWKTKAREIQKGRFASKVQKTAYAH